MRKSLLAAVAIASSATVWAQGIGAERAPASKMRADLPQVVAQAAPGELIPITVVMNEQADRSTISGAHALSSKNERREFVKSTLKSVAQASQTDLLAFLREREVAGEATRIRPLWLHNVVGARATADVVQAIATRNDVAYVNYDRPVGEEVFPYVPTQSQGTTGTQGGFNEIECGVDLMDADRVWTELDITGRGVVVGVIDTGMCLTHPDIQNQVWTNPCEIPNNGIDDDNNGFIDDVFGWNFQDDNNNVNDTHSHGSHVSGTVAGDGAQGTQAGMAPDVQIMTLKFWNSLSGEQSVWDSMQYGLDNGADVLTASLGWAHQWNPDRATWRALCENTIAAGVIVVYASGNEGCNNTPDDVRTPGDVPDVLTIGATNCSDAKAGFSSCGPVTWQDVPQYGDHPYPPGLRKPTVSAPGVNTKSHSFCNGYTEFSGTSMATPHVAGAIALMLQADPTLDQFDVRDILEGTAVDLGTAGPDNDYGAGRVDAFAAVQMAMANGNFCGPKENSCGTMPWIESAGRSSASSASGFNILGTNAPGAKAGLLLYTDQGAATPVIPFQGGVLCLNAPFRRSIPVAASGTPGLCDGTFDLDMNAFAAGSLGGTPAAFLGVPGTAVNAQWWGRDTTQNGSYLSNAIDYTVCD